MKTDTRARCDIIRSTFFFFFLKKLQIKHIHLRITFYQVHTVCRLMLTAFSGHNSSHDGPRLGLLQKQL